jgi:hypothetical protein
VVLEGLLAARKTPRQGRVAQAPDRREAPVVKIVLTPGGRFLSMASAARYHQVSVATVRQCIREGRPGWPLEAPYQIPAGFVPVARTPWRNRGPRKREEQP